MARRNSTPKAGDAGQDPEAEKFGKNSITADGAGPAEIKAAPAKRYKARAPFELGELSVEDGDGFRMPKGWTEISIDAELGSVIFRDANGNRVALPVTPA